MKKEREKGKENKRRLTEEARKRRDLVAAEKKPKKTKPYGSEEEK